MTTLEAILIILAVSMNVFVVAEYEGSNLKVLTKLKMIKVILIFIVGQAVSYLAGFGIALLPLDDTPSDDMKRLTYALAAIICLLIGGYMLYRVLKNEKLEEKLRELSYRRFALEALGVALFTFGCGIAAGFIGHSLLQGFVTISLATIVAVVTGLYTGYSQGNRFRKIGYGVTSALFMVVGVEVLLRCL